MARLHEIKATIEALTGLTAFDENGAISVLITGDQPELIPVIADKLRCAGVTFTQSKHRRFKGAAFTLPIRNVGTAFAANWEFA